ncbi:TIGR04197 family type VII secretion effector [Carnobacterium gallinarum]|uniref:TIGR04197 family type VII secretion effector n=1 Tax=Carnobacterium gallinarum TaxID=2749 RepID=UPI00054D77B9|nr:TIGR04197 family type VII secretion effector [Carnobacterium gallinarum]
MEKIKSDLTEASQKATGLKNTTDNLKQISTIETDWQTTIVGNQEAQEKIQLAQETAKQIASAIMLGSMNLQSVAKDFEALDQLVSQTEFQRMGG